MKCDLTRLGISHLNTMQQAMLHAASDGNSIVLLSPTGSGKTLAYMIPLLQKLDAKHDALQALIIVPSRELAIQTADVARRLCPELRVAACYGGRPAMEEHRQMRGLRPHLVAATPGRLLDHLQKGNIATDTTHTLVIDEFDKSLELGFRQQMHDAISLMPRLQQRILLSATDADDIPAFVGSGNATRLSFLDEQEGKTRIKLKTVQSPEKDKLDTLRRLLCQLGAQKSLVFAGYRESVERIGKYLEQQGIKVGIFHGGMEQRDRERALYRFMNSSCNIFVSTDLASRGLDICAIDNVIHYHLPTSQEACTHRNGRTARWDADGLVYFILGPEEYLPDYIDMQDVETYTMPATVPNPAEPHWTTLYIGKGKKDKISRGDIVGFLTKQGGLKACQIGRIDVLPHWAYAAVERTCAAALLARVSGQKIKGQRTLFEVAED